MECLKCGASENRTLLFDAISNKGVVKICRKCSLEEDLPIIKKPTTFQLKDSEKQQSIRHRLSSSSGISRSNKTKEFQTQEITLKDLVEKNYKKRIPEKTKLQLDLIDNFNWIIMRARRMKKITQEQLAKELVESKTAIQMAEQGVLPEDGYRLINKLEAYLGIRLIKKEIEDSLKNKGNFEESYSKLQKNRFKSEISFDPHTARNLTIADLKEMKAKTEAEMFDKSNDETNEKIAKDIKKSMIEDEKKDLSEDEISDIIFGRKIED